MRRAVPAAATLLLALSVLVSSTLVAAPATAAEEYPSWQEVEAATASTAASAAAAARIDTLLTGLQATADEAGEQAIVAADAANRAASEEAAAAARAETLSTQLDAAGEQAQEGKDQLGRIAAQLYRAGAADMTRVFLSAAPASSAAASDASDDMLRQLGTASRVSALAASLREKALGEQDLVSALTGDARRAERERAALADATESSRVAAERASAEADAELGAQREAAETLYAQLAVLRSTTAELERGYRDGVAAEAAFAEQQAAAERAAAEAAAGSPAPSQPAPSQPAPSQPAPSQPDPPSPGPGPSAPPPAEVVVDPAAARAYAAGAVAARGWGSEQFDCLVALWNRESGWRANAYNASSGAYGIPQALPGSKMSVSGDDWRTNAATQIEWGLSYIGGRYGNPCGAWQHSETVGWY
ncbi:hypothetical protein ASC66_00520 [Leifsonia sp. Root4]|nr:hypothetical protein ASC66_00520 [Leifsonia sp. Root4]